MVGVIETAKSSINTFDQILKLQKEIDEKLQSLGIRASKAQLVMSYLYQHPIIDANKVKEVTGSSSPSAYKLIEEMEKLKILHEITGAKRGRLYMFGDYVNLFK